MEKYNNKNIFLVLLEIQVYICMYSIISVISKFASRFEFKSIEFILLYGVILFLFFAYAFVWQKLLKKYPLFLVYFNRGSLPIWGLLWSVVFFDDTVTTWNVIGTIIVIMGIIMVLVDDK